MTTQFTKRLIFIASILLLLTFFSGCDKPVAEIPPKTSPSASPSTKPPTTDTTPPNLTLVPPTSGTTSPIAPPSFSFKPADSGTIHARSSQTVTVDLRTKDKDKAAIATSKVGAETELIDRVPESKADLLTQEALKIIDTEARNAFLVHNDSYFQVDLNERRIEQNKDISIKYHPKALSSADIANGIEAAGMFAYGSKVYRKTMLVDGRATKWQDWRDSRLAFFYGDLVKRKGQWSISIQNGALREHVFAPRVSDLPTLD